VPRIPREIGALYPNLCGVDVLEPAPRAILKQKCVARVRRSPKEIERRVRETLDRADEFAGVELRGVRQRPIRDPMRHSANAERPHLDVPEEQRSVDEIVGVSRGELAPASTLGQRGDDAPVRRDVQRHS
jgi:hypothetical protein